MTPSSPAARSTRASRVVRAVIDTAGAGAGAVLVTTVVTLSLGAALKAYCLTPWTQGHQPKTCYNDIQTLWFQRALDVHAPPYQGSVTLIREGGHLVSVVLGAGEIEYPVLTGVFAWASALPASNHAQYLAISALALTPFALVASYALFRLSGRRALLFAASPQLAAYAFLNWDLLPVAATAGALWAWRARRPGTTAVLLTLGLWAKIWPGFLLVPLLLSLLLGGRRRDAVRIVVAAAATSLLVNVPFILANPLGWAAPYLAQSVRLNDRTTNAIWYWLAPETAFGTVNPAAGIAVAAGWAAVLVAGQRIARRRGDYPWVQVGAAMVSVYMVLGRVDSPQYGLWLVPFLVVLDVRPRWIALFMASDMWLWFQWSWLWSFRDWFHNGAVVLRILVLLALTVVFLRSGLRLTDATGGRHDPDDPRRIRPPDPAAASDHAPEPTAERHR
jgi:hypothetical protein